MQVANLLASVSRAGGGITEVVRALTQHLARCDLDVHTFGLQDDWTEADLAAWYPAIVRTFAAVGPRGFGYAPRLQACVSELKPDVLHCHGLWMYPSLVSRRIASRGLPEVVSPHGMLDPWALKNSVWKKRIARMLFEDSHLRDAACLHALGAQELAAIRENYPANAVCVIPNGIALSPQGPPEPEHLRCDAGSPGMPHVLLHLGRIHPKKGLTELISAWAAARKDRVAGAQEWMLIIAGWEGAGPSYQAALRQQAAECGVADSISFPGPLFGAAKAAALRGADAFVLASMSEGMPMTILEAWANRLPVIMTPECNISEGFDAGAALCVKPTKESLREGLAQLFSMSDAQRLIMGEAGRNLVQQRFTWELAAQRHSAVYGWLLGGQRPDCIDLLAPRVTYSLACVTPTSPVGGASSPFPSNR